MQRLKRSRATALQPRFSLRHSFLILSAKHPFGYPFLMLFLCDRDALRAPAYLTVNETGICLPDQDLIVKLSYNSIGSRGTSPG